MYSGNKTKDSKTKLVFIKNKAIKVFGKNEITNGIVMKILARTICFWTLFLISCGDSNVPKNKINSKKIISVSDIKKKYAEFLIPNNVLLDYKSDENLNDVDPNIIFIEVSDYMYLQKKQKLDSTLTPGNCYRHWYKKGKVIKEESFGKNHEILGTCEYRFNPKGQLSSLHSNGNYLSGTKEYFIYDKNDLLRIHYRIYEKSDHITVSKYDSLRRLIEIRSWESIAPEKVYINQHYYTGTSKLIDSTIYFYSKTPTKKIIKHYEYDRAGNKIRELTKDKTESEVYYEYDSQNNLIREIYNGDFYFYSSYQYDSHGNWIIKTTYFNNGTKSSVTHRKIKYSNTFT